MNYSSIPFQWLPYSDLFREYAQQSESLQPFYQGHPFNDVEVVKRAEQFRFQGNRQKSVQALIRFNKLFDVSDLTIQQIEKLGDPKALTVVTGQQLSLFGGPLFTVYKTLTAIIYAHRWEKLLGRPVIPVFWLADEDHDYQEAGEIGVLNNDRLHQLEMDNGRTNQPVGRELLGPDFHKFEEEFLELLPQSDFSEKLIHRLKQFYREGNSFRSAFGNWLMYLFADRGLILAGSDDPEIKKLISDPMLTAAENHAGLFESLDEQSFRLEEEGFPRQALVQPSNIFYIDPDKGRLKLDVSDGEWTTGNGRRWDRAGISDDIRNNPEKFSPNVFLRPIMQDLLLPTLAYVCGPGELSYYGQMKAAYECMGQEMPMLVPRFCITLIEPGIDRISKELPFEFHEYAKRVEDLESLYLDRIVTHDVEGIFTDWSKRFDEITEEKKNQINRIDPTLVPSADRAGAVLKNELDKLKGKTYRSIKKRETIQLDRIRRVKENLFPDGDLQERKVSFLYYMIKYGPDVWDRLLEVLENEIPDSHKILHL